MLNLLKYVELDAGSGRNLLKYGSEPRLSANFSKLKTLVFGRLNVSSVQK